MKFSYLRPTTMLALALALSACGGSNTFTVNVSISDLRYNGLVLVDTISGTELVIAPGTTSASFPKSINYGTEYAVVIRPANGNTPIGQPAHQNCVVGGGSDTAGRLSSINVVVACTILKPTVAGTIVFPAGTPPTGLTITNGSRPPVTAVASSTGYTFPLVEYNTTFGPIITAQPAGLNCKFEKKDPPVANVTVSPDQLSYAGVMGDTDVTVNVICVAAP